MMKWKLYLDKSKTSLLYDGTDLWKKKGDSEFNIQMVLVSNATLSGSIRY